MNLKADPLTDHHIQACRNQFPALTKTRNGKPVVYFDGPAGTQVPQRVVDAMRDYLLETNANMGGMFHSSRASDDLLAECQQAAADFLGVADAGEIAFGQNMTSLTFALSRSLARTWESGDEVVVTRLDHDANISPWVLAARDAGCQVRYVDFDADGDCRLNIDQLADSLSDRTRLVAFGAASNASGGVNPVSQICQMIRERSDALTFVDAVHYGPHRRIDVQSWESDFVACSAYKFFGPHQGMVWGKRHVLESLPAYKVRPASDELPYKWMSGTQSHEGIAGTRAAIDYLADLGRMVTENESLPRPEALDSAFMAIEAYERRLSAAVLEVLQAVPGIKVYGITNPSELSDRVPTFSITHSDVSTGELARELGERGIYVWDGNYYALEFSEQLGLEPAGMVRIGLVHYNTLAEVDALQDALHQIVSNRLLQKG